MRQIWITRAGSPDVLQLREAEIPSPASGEVRIAVEASGVNFADVMGRLGLYPDAPPIPYVPGYEVAGHIDAVGDGVSEDRLGELVIALVRFGGYGEFICVPHDQAFHRPAGMSVEEAAGFPVAYLTAYMSLVIMAGIKPGDHVLIHAAAGGVGLAAVDIAQIFNATIYGTASASKHDFLRERGVQHPIDYRHKDFEREVKRLTNGRGVQIALDSVGGRSWLKSYRTLSAAGRMVAGGVSSLAPGERRSVWGMLKFALTVPWWQFNPVSLANANKGVAGINLGRLWDERALLRVWMDQVLAWYTEGHLHPKVDKVFPLEEAAAAHRYLQERRNIGKVILKP
ncbi:MAG: zinc-binding dehydrogenase [Chloroflexi bacterium]|nr:zinc-binding dehydrogenase [Chloroflexota bacterium]